MSVVVVGLDVSLTAFGVCVARPGEDPCTMDIGSASVDSTDEEATHTRIVDLTARVLARAREGRQPNDRVLFVMEKPAFSSSSGMAHVRAGLWRMVYHFGRKEGSFVTVGIQNLKQYATGKGNSDKQAMLLAAERAFPRAGASNDNQADAAWLAAMGMRELGHPFEVAVQRCHPQHLSKVTWPQWVGEYRDAH